MRGKGSRSDRPSPGLRITPAYAGKSALRFLPHCQKWDHPRVCGEKDITPVCCTRRPGSPPRMRGKDALSFFANDIIRITPAYAGKSFLQRTAQCRCQDHPRVCGEKFLVYRYPMNHLGSPPRMRGKDQSPQPLCHCGRDHPRVCGEKTNPLTSGISDLGSPPRMRGKD